MTDGSWGALEWIAYSILLVVIFAASFLIFSRR